jgi:hypothetical protein
MGALHSQKKLTPTMPHSRIEAQNQQGVEKCGERWQNKARKGEKAEFTR